MMVNFPAVLSYGRGWKVSWSTRLALLSGVMLSVALPPFPPTIILVPVALVLFFQALLISRRPGRTGLIFGLAHQATLLHWLFFLDPSKSIPSPILVPVQALAAIAYVSLFYCGLGWIWGRLTRGHLGRSIWLLPVLWFFMEYLRGLGELGFPWCLSGSGLVGSPLMFLYRAAGELGVGLGFALLASSALSLWAGRGLSRSFQRRNSIPMVVGTLLWWAFLLAGANWHGDADTPEVRSPWRVAAIQPDVALADKWAAGRLDSTRVPLTNVTRMAVADGAEFVVWPETAVPAYLRYDQSLLSWVRATARENHIFLFTGFPDAERSPAGKVLQYNSSGLFSPQGNLVAQYAKYHLLPIGESMPFEKYLPFLAKVDVGQAEWTPGSPPRPLQIDRSGEVFPFSGLICFESVFSQLARASVRAGSRCLVIITNDGWFGRSAGPVQHALLARIRAAENGVPVIRCANNGISFICDATGSILDYLPVGVRGFVRADIQTGPGDTLFLRWGWWSLVFLIAVWLGFAVLAELQAKGEE